MFKNATIYTLSQDVTDHLSSIIWDAVIEDFPQKPPGPLEYQSIGFTDVAQMTPSIVDRDAIFLAVMIERRVLPAAAVDRELKERVRKIERDTGEKLGGKARGRLKGDIVAEMLPKAFIKPQRVQFYIDRPSGLIVIDATRGVADTVLSFLRRCLGSLPALPVSTDAGIPGFMLDWVMGQALPSGVALGDKASFKSPMLLASATFNGRLPDAEGIEELRGNAYKPTKLELYTDTIAFMFDESYALRSISPIGTFFDKRDEAVGEDGDVAKIQTADLMIMRQSIANALTLIGGKLPISR
ncbi:MAG: recombination-associated protein RdgC [Silanimonas sp.]